MTRITLGQINPTVKVKYDNIASDYDVFKVNYDPDKDYAPKYARLVNLEAKRDALLTLTYYQKELYLLCKKDAFKSLELQNLLQNQSDLISKTTKLSASDLEELPKVILVKLFLNRLQDDRLLKGSGRTNRRFFYPNLKQIHNKQKIMNLDEPLLNPNLNLNIKTTFFTNMKLFNNPATDKRLRNKDLYNIDLSKAMMTGVDKTDNQANLFINAPLIKGDKPKITNFYKDHKETDQLFGGKNRYNAFIKTKSGMAYYILDSFNEQFSKYFTPLKFKEIEAKRCQFIGDDGKEWNSSKYVESFKQHLSNLTQEHRIILVDDTLDAVDVKEHHLKELAKKFKKYNLKVQVNTEEPQNDDLVISLINDKASYNAIKKKDKSIDADPYQKERPVATQHVTVENIKNAKSDKALESLLYNLINQLIIKYDLREKELTLLSANETAQKMTFYTGFYSSESPYLLESIYEIRFTDQKHFEVKDLTPFNEPKVAEMLRKPSDVEMVIKYKGLYYTISRLNDYTLPNACLYEDLKNDRLDNDVTVRNIKHLDQYISGLTNISYWKENNNFYYVVGKIGKGLNTTVNKASHVRKIKCISSEEQTQLSNQDMFNLMKMMLVPEVKYAELTVLPFPLKYLRESYWVDNKNDDSSSDESDDLD